MKSFGSEAQTVAYFVFPSVQRYAVSAKREINKNIDHAIKIWPATALSREIRDDFRVTQRVFNTVRLSKLVDRWTLFIPLDGQRTDRRWQPTHVWPSRGGGGQQICGTDDQNTINALRDAAIVITAYFSHQLIFLVHSIFRHYFNGPCICPSSSL